MLGEQKQLFQKGKWQSKASTVVKCQVTVREGFRRVGVCLFNPEHLRKYGLASGFPYFLEEMTGHSGVQWLSIHMYIHARRRGRMYISFNAVCFFSALIAPFMGCHCLETDFTQITAAGTKGREKSITLFCFGHVAVLCFCISQPLIMKCSFITFLAMFAV